MIITQELIESIKKKDRKVLTELYKDTFSVLMSVVVRFKHNEDEQMTLVNNSFLKIIQKIDTYKVGTAYFSWAKRIAQNEVIDDFRREKKFKQMFQFKDDMQQYETEDETDREELDLSAKQLQEMLNTLPPATKLVFNLFAIDGFTSKEIMQELSIGSETVKWHLKEARKKLRLQIEKVTRNEKIKI